MQKLAFGRVVTETKKEVLTENALKARIKELVHSSLGEAKKKKKEKDVVPQEDIDLELDATEEMPEDTMAPEPANSADINPTVKSIQDLLQQSYAQAKELGDAKLATQIGNTLTMVLKDQVLGLGEQVVNEIEEGIEDLSQNILDQGIVGKSKGDIFLEAWHLAVNSDLTDEEAWKIYSKGNVNI
jgi:hypothetical protein